jgi:catalase
MTRLRSGTDRTFDPLDDTKLSPEEVFEPKKVGTLQLPVNSAKNATVAINQRDGQMTYFVDTGGENPHVNYEPSTMGGLAEADHLTHDEQGPVIQGRLTRAQIPRTNDYQQAGERFRLMEAGSATTWCTTSSNSSGRPPPRYSGGWCGTSSWSKTSWPAGWGGSGHQRRRRKRAPCRL